MIEVLWGMVNPCGWNPVRAIRIFKWFDFKKIFKISLEKWTRVWSAIVDRTLLEFLKKVIFIWNVYFFVVEILLFEWLVDLLEERLIIHSYEKHNFARVRKVFPSISNIVTNQQEGLSGGSVEISKDLIGLTNLDLKFRKSRICRQTLRILKDLL